MKTNNFVLFLIFLFVLRISNLSAQPSQVLSLDEAISIGLQNSYEIRSAEITLKQSEHSLNAWKLSYSTYVDLFIDAPIFTNRFRELADPTSGKINIVKEENLSFRSNFSINQPILITDGTLSLQNSWFHLLQGDEKLYQSDLFLNYNQPLFQTSQRKIDLKRAGYNLIKVKSRYNQQKRDIRFSIIEKYLNLLRAKKNFEIYQESKRRTQETYQTALTRYNTGLLSESEFLNIKIDNSNEKIQFIRTKENYQNLLGEFLQFIGLKEKIEIVDKIGIDSIAIIKDELLHKAISNDPQIIQYQYDTKIQELNIKLQQSRKQFAIDLNLQYGISQLKENLSSFFEGPEQSQVAQISLTIPLWDSGQNQQRVLGEQEQLKIFKLDKKNRIKLLKVEINNIYDTYTNSKKILTISTEAKSNAFQNYKFQSLRFTNGNISSDDLSLARQRYNTASINHLNAQIDYVIAVEKIKKHLTPITE